ncbi:MAG: hypothetical protein HQ481_10025 [Alphaproteobacteria bacterium]|nr:hypothetical protein [Alphaproteobacteria bacterium]
MRPKRTVRRPRRSAAIALASLLTLAGCQIANPFPPIGGPAGGASNKESNALGGGDAPASTFSQFNDIPIPTDAELDLDQSLILGTEDGWIGRVSLDVGYGMTDMYSFYEREMPKFGWEQLTTVRAKISTMTYRRGSRVATITLQSTLTSGTYIDFTVAPANRAVMDRPAARTN